MTNPEVSLDRWASSAPASSAAPVGPSLLDGGGDTLIWVPVAICLLTCLVITLVGSSAAQTEPPERSRCLIGPVRTGLSC